MSILFAARHIISRVVVVVVLCVCVNVKILKFQKYYKFQKADYFGIRVLVD